MNIHRGVDIFFLAKSPASLVTLAFRGLVVEKAVKN